MRRHVVGFGDGLSDTVLDLFKITSAALGAFKLLNHDQPLLAAIALDGKRRAAVTAQSGMTFLNRALDVLRMVVGAPYDDQILDAPDDEQIAVSVHKSKVAGSQPLAFLPCDPRSKRRFA
jgi:hypothetical protein